MTRKKKIILYVVVAATITVVVGGTVGGIWLYQTMMWSPLRRALPSGASEVQDLYIDSFLDYSYYLKARMSEQDFITYCRQLGLTPHTPERLYSDEKAMLSWDASDGPLAWWQSTESLDGTFVRQSGHEWTLAKRENGIVYVKAWSH